MSHRVLDAALVRWFDEFAEHGIFTTDRHLTVTSWNRWLERHSGRMADEVVGRPLFEAYPDLGERGFDEHYREALAGHAYLASHLLHGHLLPMRTRFGEHLFATMRQRARIAPLVASDSVVGTITLIDDVSERVASEHELRRQIEAQEAARAAAEAALRVKDDFLATLSHEIRTPLNAVLGWTRILRDRRLDPALISRGIAVIDRNTMLQMRMVDDLLDTARIMAGKLRLQMEPVDLVPVAIAALDVVTPAAEAKGLTLTRMLDPNVARVLGDPDRLQQVLWNLLSNAVKFSEKGKAIDFRLEGVDDSIRITVSDTGKGISPEFLPFVFDRFRQADPSSSRREAGLGLGLALVKELVGLHGGTIEVLSEGAQKGTAFLVELPALVSTHAETEARVPGHHAGGDGRLRGLHVLVLAEEPDVRDLLFAALSQQDASVTAVASAAEAVEALAPARSAMPPDVLIADIAAPEDGGHEQVRHLRALLADASPRIRTIAVSAYSSPDLGELARSAGYVAHVPKPLDVDALLQAVLRAAEA